MAKYDLWLNQQLNFYTQQKLNKLINSISPFEKYNRENDLYKFSKRNVQKSPFFRCLSSCLRISFKRLLIGV